MGATDPKTMGNTNTEDATDSVSDVKIVGNPDNFQLLCKASSQSEGWMKSTKAMEIPGAGCLVQVTTQQKDQYGAYSTAEALTFVPGVKIKDDINGGRKLVRG